MRSHEASLEEIPWRGEDETVEFKKSFAELDAALKTLGAFASQEGGTVVFGVSPQGRVVGAQAGANTLENLARAINDRIDPTPEASIGARTSQGHTVYAVSVRGDRRLRSVDGRFFKRVGRTTLRMSTEEVRRRLAAEPNDQGSSARLAHDDGWLAEHQAAARRGLGRLALPGIMELLLVPDPGMRPSMQPQLLKAANTATVEHSGWPIGVVLQDERRPRSRKDGIVAEVVATCWGSRSYDYWALRADGAFYTLRNLVEDERAPREGERVLFVDTRIVEVTEALLYCRRLYEQLGAREDQVVTVRVRLEGLAGRVVGCANPRRVMPKWYRAASENASESQISVRLADIKANLPTHVKALVAPLLALFDFLELSEQVYRDIVVNFAAGRLT